MQTSNRAIAIVPTGVDAEWFEPTAAAVQPKYLPLAEATAARALNLTPVHDVIWLICVRFRVDREELLSKERTQPLALIRQIAMYVARRATGRSYPVLGREFGGRDHARGRDHTTIMSACRRVEELMAKDQNLRETVEALIVEAGA